MPGWRVKPASHSASPGPSQVWAKQVASRSTFAHRLLSLPDPLGHLAAQVGLWPDLTQPEPCQPLPSRPVPSVGKGQTWGCLGQGGSTWSG